MTRGRNTADKRRRAQTIAAYTHCIYCGKPVDKTLPGRHPFGPSEAHIIPLCEGGDEWDPDNLALAHLRCNVLADHARRAIRRRQTLGRVKGASRAW